ncbi:GDP-mannose 4,6-dehydratase [Rhodanobacter sp. 115]|uniref:GDP-mannose 4,6-dehydratase n=1 Tax=Rhodanobacter sp. FW021-MT20 TaxID=1162282 RepID=UPI001ED94889|nr:GDP-mannose 4,6-dehydratase [Rhodanobacter sp. 115]
MWHRRAHGANAGARQSAVSTAGEVDLLIGDAGKAREKLGWSAETPLETLCQMMVEADLRRNEHGHSF